MTALKDILNKIAEEPVIVNAFRKATGKPPVGQAELEVMNQLKALEGSLAGIAWDLARVPELRREAARTGLFSLDVKPNTKLEKSVFTQAMEKALHCKIAVKGTYQHTVAEVADVQARARSIAENLDNGVKLPELQDRVRSVMNDAGKVYENFRKVQEPVMPKDGAEESLKKLEEKMDRFAAAAGELFDRGGRAVEALAKKIEEFSKPAKRAEGALPGTPARPLSRAEWYDQLRRKAGR